MHAYLDGFSPTGDASSHACIKNEKRKPNPEFSLIYFCNVMKSYTVSYTLP